MKIRDEDLLPEVRIQGRIIRRLLPHYTKSSFKLVNTALDRFLKGRWFGRHTAMEERLIEREDGSQLRICICRYSPEVSSDDLSKSREYISAGKRRPVSSRTNSKFTAEQRVDSSKDEIYNTEYKTENAENGDQTGMLWIHGGGYATGLPEIDYSFAERYASYCSCVVVMPDYRKSMDAPYPAAILDCVTALRWMKEHSDELGIRKNQIFVGGDSAGGGLTAALCLHERDHNGVAIAFQMPLYPMLNDRGDTKSLKDNNAPVWNEKSNAEAWKLYLESIDASGEVPEYAAPSRADSYSGLPPACTFVGTADPFYDETMEYVNGLRSHDIPVRIKVYKGCFHGFDVVCPKTRVGRDAASFQIESLNYARKHYFAEQADSD